MLWNVLLQIPFATLDAILLSLCNQMQSSQNLDNALSVFYCWLSLVLIVNPLLQPVGCVAMRNIPNGKPWWFLCVR